MDFGLKDKVAFVAASSSGLGRASAIELAREGAHVIMCARNGDSLEAAREEVDAAGEGEVWAIQGDLSSTTDINRIIKTTLSHYLAVDILVTNTGGPPTGKFEDLDQDEWDKAYRQLLASVTQLIQGFLPGMKQRPWGRIISITSQAVKQPVENLILSNAIRVSVVGLMKTLASELGPYNITVNNVMPGYTETPRLKSLIEAKPSFSKAAETVPLGRFGQPEEFAAAVAFLASERASYITGVSLAVDGGWIKSVL